MDKIIESVWLGTNLARRDSCVFLSPTQHNTTRAHRVSADRNAGCWCADEEVPRAPKRPVGDQCPTHTHASHFFSVVWEIYISLESISTAREASAVRLWERLYSTFCPPAILNNKTRGLYFLFSAASVISFLLLVWDWNGQRWFFLDRARFVPNFNHSASAQGNLHLKQRASFYKVV